MQNLIGLIDCISFEPSKNKVTKNKKVSGANYSSQYYVNPLDVLITVNGKVIKIAQIDSLREWKFVDKKELADILKVYFK